MKHPQTGYSLVEFLMAIVLIGILAAFMVPKVLYKNDNSQSTIQIKETFTTVGEAYLAYKKDLTYGDSNLADGEEGVRFAQYLYDHLNYTDAIDPATVVDPGNTYCSFFNQYFVLPNGAQLTQFCNSSNPPRKMWVQVWIEKPKPTSFYVYFVEDADGNGESQDRYTTAYGVDQQFCVYADEVLNIVDECP